MGSASTTYIATQAQNQVQGQAAQLDVAAALDAQPLAKQLALAPHVEVLCLQSAVQGHVTSIAHAALSAAAGPII
jgi:hypothetical protein